MVGNTEKQLASYIQASEGIIPSDGLEAVRHYLDHAEYEMAFEGLLLELIKLNKYPDGFNYAEWAELARRYSLDTDSVFDGDFWSKFKSWGEAYPNI